ncbi:MmcQ/YjbR family DNA-binding protein, partial [Duncaniella freteri]|uniref:MmcQ/YjbR family DNA-binding protein n=2 Tax=Duncaniella TaxID=2518495 RepID=UPI00338FDE8D
MNIEYIRDTALSLPHVTERCPYGPDYLAFEIGGKQFCLVDLNSKWDFYNIKVDPV